MSPPAGSKKARTVILPELRTGRSLNQFPQASVPSRLPPNGVKRGHGCQPGTFVNSLLMNSVQVSADVSRNDTGVEVSRMTYRLLMGVTVLPFVIFGWLLSVWLSEQAVQAAEQNIQMASVQSTID